MAVCIYNRMWKKFRALYIVYNCFLKQCFFISFIETAKKKYCFYFRIQSIIKFMKPFLKWELSQEIDLL